MMGFSPGCPTSGEYVLTTPSFDEVRIPVPGGKSFIITSVAGNNGGKYIRAITRDGGVYPDWNIKHEDIIKGRRFTLQLSENPPVR
jgi:putative alpha-1,2-mannosidase